MSGPKRPKIYRPDRAPVARTIKSARPFENMYDHTWEIYRTAFLEANPRCYACGAKSSVVDHVEPHKGSEALFKKTDNHIPLCAKCHNTVTAKFDRAYNPETHTTEPKILWFMQMRALKGLEFRVKVLPRYGSVK